LHRLCVCVNMCSHGSSSSLYYYYYTRIYPECGPIFSWNKKKISTHNTRTWRFRDQTAFELMGTLSPSRQRDGKQYVYI
jgi:hypothetical protein